MRKLATWFKQALPSRNPAVSLSGKLVWADCGTLSSEDSISFTLSTPGWELAIHTEFPHTFHTRVVG
jgi:hypothetical protein